MTADLKAALLGMVIAAVVIAGALLLHGCAHTATHQQVQDALRQAEAVVPVAEAAIAIAPAERHACLAALLGAVKAALHEANALVAFHRDVPAELAFRLVGAAVRLYAVVAGAAVCGAAP